MSIAVELGRWKPGIESAWEKFCVLCGSLPFKSSSAKSICTVMYCSMTSRGNHRGKVTVESGAGVLGAKVSAVEAIAPPRSSKAILRVSQIAAVYKVVPQSSFQLGAPRYVTLSPCWDGLECLFTIHVLVRCPTVRGLWKMHLQTVQAIPVLAGQVDAE